jgi:L-iditol 2-dehydrogenase
MTRSMRAAVLHAAGDLRVETIPIPETLQPGEALIKVMAAGICGSDIGRVMTTGTYRFPTIPGHEFAGIVDRVGSEVIDVRPGDRVAVSSLMPCGRCESCQHGNYSLCDDYNFLGSRTDGGFAEYVRAPARNLVCVPAGVDLEEAATIEPAGVILHGLHKVGLRLGDAVAVIGCGALGYFGLRFASLAGAHPLIAVDVDEAKLDLARKAGADVCINAAGEDVSACIAEATSGRGVDIALEMAGNDAGRELAIGAVRKQGTVLLYGSAHHDVSIKPNVYEKILRREINLVGSWNSYSVPFPGREWTDIVAMLASGKLSSRPLISHRLPLEDAPSVFRQLANRQFEPYSKIIFTPHGPAMAAAAS